MNRCDAEALRSREEQPSEPARLADDRREFHLSVRSAGEPTKVAGVERVAFVESRSDEALLADHLSGEPGAFEALVARYVNELYGFLCRFVGNAAAAEDVVQETFLQVHLAAGSFNQSRPFKPWLYTIAANKARDLLRARSRRQELSLDGGPSDEQRSTAGTLEAADAGLLDSVDDSEQGAVVRALIAQMPEHLRLILVLGYYQQLPYAEIAEVLEIPVGTVKSRLHAAVNHFARLWHSHQNQSGARTSR
jgi:RNA polymerase sigma-70 factor (ECF subfamily)